MSTHIAGGPPAAPPALPPTAEANRGPTPPGQSNITVKRNSPPKRVLVLEGREISYGGHTYRGGEEGNDSFVVGDGPTADSLAMEGFVIILDHNAAEDWNGAEGDQVRKRAHAHLDAAAKAEPNDKTARDHDHGFVKWEGGDDVPADYTEHRTALAQQHMAEDRMMTEPESKGKPADQKAAYALDDPRHPDHKKGGAK